MSEPASRRDIVLYLVALTGISAATIAILAALFFTGFPRFLSGLSRDPTGTVRADPASVVLVVASVALVVLLVALVVVFGAKHALDPEQERSNSREK